MTGENNPNYGREFSEEYRKKLGDSHRGSKRSEETKRKMREAALRRNKDPEYRRKLSEAAKRRWAEDYDQMMANITKAKQGGNE